jgi:hypothetical protein
MTLRASILWLVASAPLSACLDLSPGYFAPSTDKDAAVNNVPDAGGGDSSTPDAAAGSSVEPCRMCLTSGPCKTQSDACNADANCDAFAACLTDAACWGAVLTDFNNVPACVIDCATQAQVGSQVSAAAALIVPVFVCAQNATACAPDCAPSLVQ